MVFAYNTRDLNMQCGYIYTNNLFFDVVVVEDCDGDDFGGGAAFSFFRLFLRGVAMITVGSFSSEL